MTNLVFSSNDGHSLDVAKLFNDIPDMPEVGRVLQFEIDGWTAYLDRGKVRELMFHLNRALSAEQQHLEPEPQGPGGEPPWDPEQRARAVHLAGDHWRYIGALLESHGEEESTLATAKFHYNTAFIHGYKHACEDQINE